MRKLLLLTFVILFGVACGHRSALYLPSSQGDDLSVQQS
jgi:hypothetical protein